VDLRQRAVTVRVLDAGGADVLAGQQLPHPRRDRLLPGMRPGRVHGRGVRLGRPVHGQERQRGHRDGRLQQLTQVGAGQCGLADRGRVAAHERAGVGRVQRERRQRPALPRALAQQAQRGRGQCGEIPGSDRPDHPHRRGETEVQRLGEHVEQRRVDAGAARRQLVEPDRQHGAGPADVEHRPGASGVAADQAQPVTGVIGGHRPVGAHPRGPPVYRPERGDPADDLPGQPGSFPPAGMHGHWGPVAGDPAHLLTGHADAVDQLGRGRRNA
jgi:hypothetical protein